jgi:hypothetical protein
MENANYRSARNPVEEREIAARLMQILASLRKRPAAR